MSGIRSACWALGVAIAVGVGSQTTAAQEAPEPSPARESSPQELTQSAFELMQAGRLAEAEQRFRQALTAEADFQQAQFGLGTLFFEMGRVGDAIALLEQLHEKAPDFYPVLNNLAWIYATTSELQYRDGTRAIRLAQEAIFRQPRRFQVWNTLAEAYYIIGDFSRSERAARQALRFAREQDAGHDQLVRYSQQVERARIAAHVESIFAQSVDRLEIIEAN